MITVIAVLYEEFPQIKHDLRPSDLNVFAWVSGNNRRDRPPAIRGRETMGDL